MEFDFSKLIGRIHEILGSEQEFVRRMGFSTPTKIARLTNKSPFKLPEIIRCCEILSIPIEEIPDYFFVKIVRKD